MMFQSTSMHEMYGWNDDRELESKFLIVRRHGTSERANSGCPAFGSLGADSDDDDDI